MKAALAFASTALLLVGESSATAGVLITVTQSGSDVVASGVGTLDTTSLTLPSTSDGFGVLSPFGAGIRLGPSSPTSFTQYSVISGPETIGPGGTTPASSGSGGLFGVFGLFHSLSVPSGYTSGSSLSGSATWDGTTISALGLTPGTYTWTWGRGPDADSLTVNIGTVPEPTTLTLLGIGIAGVAGGTWLRRKRVASKVPA